MNRVVFVDPDDPNCKYWWVAMVLLSNKVVPSEEHSLFFKINKTTQQLKPDEILVCYFEDGSLYFVTNFAQS